MENQYSQIGLPLDQAWQLMVAINVLATAAWLLWVTISMRRGSITEGQYHKGQFLIFFSGFSLLLHCAWYFIVACILFALALAYLLGMISRLRYLPEISAPELRGKRIALVLMGGGAKGAYEVGVWKALWDLEIRNFVSIAGTSVGALNAYLVANVDPQQAEEVWYRAVQNQILKRPSGYYWRVSAVLLGQILLFSPWLVTVAVVWYFRSAPSESMAIALAVMGNVIAIEFVLLRHLATRGWVLPLFGLEPSQGIELGRLLLFLSCAIGVTAQFTRAQLLWLVPATVLLVALFMLPVVIGLRLLISSLQEGLFPRSELNHEIAALAQQPTFRHCEGSVWSTIACWGAYVSPFEVTLGEQWPPATPPTPHWTPRYMDLKTSSSIALTLRATSAVPFAFRAEEIDGQKVVDGGVCDNWPVAPALIGDPEYVIAVGVNRGNWLAPNVALQWQIERNWTQHFFANSAGDRKVLENIRSGLAEIVRHKKGDYWDLLPDAPPIRKLRQIRFIWISPSMWSFLGIPRIQDLIGTLRFSKKYIERLIKEGYEDTKDVLESATR